VKDSERDYLFVRGETPSHQTRIPDRRHRDEREYDKLVSEIFDQQRAVYKPDVLQEERATSLARVFYSELYREPELTFGGPLGAPATSEELINDAILASGEINRNNMTFLLGEIGVGKTAYVNWLISTRLRQYVLEKRIWFVRLDLEELKQGKPVTPGELLHAFLRRICELPREIAGLLDGSEDELAVVQKSLDQLGSHDSLMEQRAEGLVGLCQHVQKQSGRRLLLILDNIDYLCHYHDRGLFYDIKDTGEQNILDAVCKFFELFNRPRELGHLGANVLAVTRTDSYEVLDAALIASYQVPCIMRGAKVFSVQSLPAREVIRIRCQLLRAAASHVPDGKRRHYDRIPALIERDLQSGKPGLIHHLRGISNDGLRQMMSFLSQYAWVGSEEDGVGGSRFMHTYPVGLHTFMLQSFCRFGQFRSKFPNIYLVNRIPTKGQTFSKTHEHRHSYWLKRLLLEFVASRQFYDTLDIFEVFTSGSAYEESIVKECLGSLTEAPTSHCIRAVRGPHPYGKGGLYIKRIELTRRGIHCLRDVFGRFFYLQLIVDEPFLPLPRVVKDVFDFECQDSQGLDYSYVVSQWDEYAEKAHAMVRIKARQVLFFLEILEHSLTLEQEVFSDVFASLVRREIALPDVRATAQRVQTELGWVSRHFREPLNIDGLQAEVADRSEQIRDELESMYCSTL
jgi:hypothetical protein